MHENSDHSKTDPLWLGARQAFSALVKLSWPVVGTRLLMQMMAFIDTIVIGHYSSQQLGYHMLGITLSWVPAVTGIGLLMGVQVKTAQFLGAGEGHRIGAVFQRGVGFAALIGGISLVALWGLGPWGLGAIVMPQLVQGAIWPLRIFALSLPWFLISIATSQLLEALGRTRDVLIATALANGLNILLLIVFVPSHIPVFGLMINGAVGAAVATGLARLALCLGLIVYIKGMKSVEVLKLFDKQPADPEGAAEQRRIGYGAGASFFIEVAAFAGMTLYAGHNGPEHVAAWAVVLNFASVVFMVPLGLATGTSVLVGRAYGAGNQAAVALMGRVSFFSSAGFMGLVCLSVLGFFRLITAAYTQDAALVPIVQNGLLMSCLFFIPDGLQVVGAQALRARNDILTPTLIHYLSYGAIMLPLGYIFSVTYRGGVPGLIWAVIIASAFSGFFQTGRYLWLDRRALRPPEPSLLP